MKRYNHIYELLRRNGHSPGTALEILWDAKRHQEHALRWVRILFRARH